MDELEEKVKQFNSHSLPGQPMAAHMGTAYLVNDLWREVQKLRAAQQGANRMADAESDKTLVEYNSAGVLICKVCGTGLGVS